MCPKISFTYAFPHNKKIFFEKWFIPQQNPKPVEIRSKHLNSGNKFLVFRGSYLNIGHCNYFMKLAFTFKIQTMVWHIDKCSYSEAKSAANK
jgi:hypothetical protein